MFYGYLKCHESGSFWNFWFMWTFYVFGGGCFLFYGLSAICGMVKNLSPLLRVSLKKTKYYFGMIGTTARDCFFEIKMILLMIDIISTLWNSNDYHCYSIWVFLYKLNGFWRAIEELWSVLGCAPEIKMLNWGWADLRIRGNVCRL